MGSPSTPVAMTGTTGLDAGNTASSEKGRDVEVGEVLADLCGWYSENRVDLQF